MFNAEDEDASLRTPPVRPNDILDIEVSPISHFSSGILPSLDSEPGNKPESSCHSKTGKGTKERREKGSKSGTSVSKPRKHSESPMKRGDPFLPSVISDENPFVDYPVRKASRKKPSDCKCKGSGYNLSPSALLPEEMRQQWGVGVFGKPTPPKVKVAVSPCLAAGTPKAHTICPSTVKVNTTFSEQPRSVFDVDSCPICLTDQCACSMRSQESFRVPERSDKRYTKSRTSSSKKKDNRNSSCVKGNSSMAKRIACYSYKENRNIISTSNFNKHASSCKGLPESNYTPMSFENSHYKSSLASSRMNGHVATLSSLDFNKTYSGRSDISITPKSEVRNPVKPRRILANITPSPAFSNSAGHLSSMVNAYESSKSLSRAAKQMLLIGDKQACSCPSCRRPNHFVSRMESLGFPSSQAPHSIYSPIVFPTSQRYNSAGTRSPYTSNNRYSPYVTPSYNYNNKCSDTFYGASSDVYRPSSPTYDSFYRSHYLSSTPLSMAQEISKIDTMFSFDDIDAAESPPADDCKDITDMSIKDTVDFFIGMKSPFVTSSPSALSDTDVGGIYSSMSPEEDSLSPCYPDATGTCPCTIGSCPGAFTGSVHGCSEFGCGEHVQRAPMAFSEGNLSQQPPRSATPILRRTLAPPMPLLYSSLVSDLEVELRSAIENIPTD